MTNTQEENAADLASEKKPGVEQLADWKYAVANNDTVLGLEEWIEHQQDMESIPGHEPEAIEFTANLERNIEQLEQASVTVKALNEASAIELIRAMNDAGQLEWRSTNIETVSPLDWEITSPKTCSTSWKDDCP